MYKFLKGVFYVSNSVHCEVLAALPEGDVGYFFERPNVIDPKGFVIDQLELEDHARFTAMRDQRLVAQIVDNARRVVEFRS